MGKSVFGAVRFARQFKADISCFVGHAASLQAATLLSLLVCSPCTVLAQTDVLTRSYDNARTGANRQETQLTPASVPNLKRLRSLNLRTFTPTEDRRLEAQPLYVSHLKTADGVVHAGALIVCTMANNVYAFDVNTGAKLWGPLAVGPGKPITPLHDNPKLPKSTEIDMYGINDRWGILSTPVIDPDTNTLYLVNWSSPDGLRKNPKLVHTLHAIRITDGKELRSLPIQASVTVNGKTAAFTSPRQKQRAALLLVPQRQPAGAHVPKTLIMASGQFGEKLTDPHGWVMAFDVDSFRKTADFCTTPTTGGGGIWQAGQGPAADPQGNLYVMTSNGGWDGKTDFAESFLRLQYTPPVSPTKLGSLVVKDWFTPFLDGPRQKKDPRFGYDFRDQDLGSGACVLPPDTGQVLGAGKDGVLYVFDRNNLGKRLADQIHPDLAHNAPLLNAAFFTYFPGANLDHPLGKLDFFADGKTHHLHGSPIYWNNSDVGPMLFVWGENAPLRSWSLKANGGLTFLGQSQETASAFSARFDAMPGGMLTLSANGGTQGIVWATVPLKGPHDTGDANKEIVAGVLRAYDAVTFDATPNADGTKRLRLLFDSLRSPANAFTYNKFCPPFVADGKVFVTTYDGRIDIYGL